MCCENIWFPIATVMHKKNVCVYVRVCVYVCKHTGTQTHTDLLIHMQKLVQTVFKSHVLRPVWPHENVK